MSYAEVQLSSRNRQPAYEAFSIGISQTARTNEESSAQNLLRKRILNQEKPADPRGAGGKILSSITCESVFWWVGDAARSTDRPDPNPSSA